MDAKSQRCAARSCQKFRTMVASMLIILVAALFLPWALVPTRILSTIAASAWTLSCSLMLVGAWWALLTELSDPSSASNGSEASRENRVGSMLRITGAIVGALLLFSTGSFAAGIIETDGLMGTGLLTMLLGVGVVRAFAVRPLGSPGAY